MSFLNRNNLFGGAAGGGGGGPQRDPYGQVPSPNRRPPGGGYGGGGGGPYDTPMSGGGYDYPRQQPGYGPGPGQGLPARNPPPRQQGHQQNPSRGGGGGGPGYGQVLTLQPAKSPDNTYTFRNLVAVSTRDLPPSRDGSDILLLVNKAYVVSARPLDNFPPGTIGLSEPQRSWMGVALTDQIQAEVFDPFADGNQAYIGSADIEIGFASTRKIVDTPYDQDELAKEVTRVSHSRHRRTSDTHIFSTVV